MSWRRRAELGALLALCLFLPLYEAPKNIAWLLYVVIWVANRFHERDWGGRWDGWDTLIAAWLASGFVVAAFAGLHGDEWRGAVDLVRYAGLLWFVKRSSYSGTEKRWVLYTLVASTLIGLAMGHWALWTGQRASLELNSVGHVNHTAVYLAIMLGVCCAWLFAESSIVSVAAVALLVVSVVTTASRGAAAVALVMLVILGVAWWPRSRRPLVVALALTILTMAAAWVGHTELLAKQEENTRAGNVLAYRDGVWRVALAAWQRYPVFGIGMDNYHLVDLARVKRWREEAGKEFDPSRYAQFPHAHSLYLNTLAERGVVGTVALAAVLAAWLLSLLRHRPGGGAPSQDWMLWGSAAAAWIVTAGIGVVNTTLHHEHGILAALLLGLWLQNRQRFNPAQRNPDDRGLDTPRP